MFQSHFAVFLGKQLEKGYFGFIAEDNFFFILYVQEGLNAEKGRDFLFKLKEVFLTSKIEDLNSYEETISQIIKEENLPAQISFAGGCLIDNVLYLKTNNEGRIYLSRKNNLGVIIEGNLSASGYIEDKDFLIFTTKKITQFFQDNLELQKYFNKRTPTQIIDEITPAIKAKEDQGLIILLVQFLKKEEVYSEEENLFQKSKFNLFLIDKLKNRLINFKNNFSLPVTPSNKKFINLILVLLIFFLLLWSVVFGAKRRQESKVKEKIKITQIEIEKKLTEAEDLAFFNLKQAQESLNSSYQKLASLKKEVGQREEIDNLNKKIKQTENKIYKKEEKKEEEFFDLAVENKEAKGDKIYLEGENLFVLDKKNKTVYQLSLTKKSLNIFKNEEIEKSKLIAVTNEKIFLFFERKGIYQLLENNKIKKVIDYDSYWEEIVDFVSYNNNLYLLDNKKNEIYKYTPTTDGFSSKISYFKGGGQALNNALSLAIDMSVYVALPDKVFKFTAGVQEDFKFDLPEKKLNLTKVYTNKNLEKIYLWNKKQGVIYILSKNGTYERQILAEVIKKANDFVVFKNKAILVWGSKIYQIEL